MKTAMIARFVLGAGAIFAAAGLVGCGAGEQGSGDPGAIGSTSEALTTAAVDDTSAAEFATSCTVTDTSQNKDYVLQIGGKTSAGSYLRNITVFDPSQSAGSQWLAASATTFGTNGTDNRWHLSAIKVPGTDAECLIAGGADGSGNPAATFTVTAAFNHPGVTLTVASAGSMNTSRADVALEACGSKVIAIGGSTGSALTTSSSAIEVWDGSWHTATGTNPTLNTSRFNFGIIAEPDVANNTYRYLVSGGKNTSSGRLNSLEQFVVTNSCDPTAVVRGLPTATLLSNAADGMEGNVLLPTGTASQYVSTAGYRDDAVGGAAKLVDSEQLITVNWTTPASTTVGAESASSILPTHLPKLVKDGSTSYLIGGTNKPFANSPSSLTSNDIQKHLAAGTWSSVAAASGFHRAGVVASLMPNRTAKLFIAAGASYTTGTPTDRVKSEAVTP